MNASTARLRFQLRGLTNLSLVIAIFLVAAFVFAPFPWAWVADAIAAALLLYFFFFVIEKRAIGLACGSCQKHIASNVPWFCGICHKTNTNVDEFPFLHRCAHCSAEPKAYKCHHCEEIIFLTQDKLSAGYARCVQNEAKTTEKDKTSPSVPDAAPLVPEATVPTKKQELDAMLEKMESEFEKGAAITKREKKWRKAIASDKKLTEEEKKNRIEEMERVIEQARHDNL